MMCLPDNEESLRICLLVSTEYMNVTDTQVDRQTDGHCTTVLSALLHCIVRQKLRVPPAGLTAGTLLGIAVLAVLLASIHQVAE